MAREKQSSMRKVAVLTGKRGGYGAMKPMLRLIANSPHSALQLICTDQHLSQEFGRTIEEIEKDFVVASAIDMRQDGPTPLARSAALGRFAIEFAEAITELAPDILVLYGDRGEVLQAAHIATQFNLPIAHLQGGDRSGSVDEQVRHAITKLSHLHFPSTEASAKRIASLGEDLWRIHVVGDSHVEEICQGNFWSFERVKKYMKLNDCTPVIVVLQHSETTNPGASRAQMDETLTAIRDLPAQKVVVYPCSDVGYEGVIESIRDHALIEYGFSIYRNIEAPIFWGLLSGSKVLLGNSSAGIIESSYFSLPTVNIGRRQVNRECSSNVLHVDHDRNLIKAIVNRLLSDKEYYDSVCSCTPLYGDGKTSSLVFEVLRTVSLDDHLKRKFITF